MTVEPFTILHVEDDANDVLLVQRALRKAAAATRIFSVNDGDQAIAYLSGQPPFASREQYPLPNLVLLDLKMPRKSGLEVLQWLRERKEFRRVVVAIFTSSKHDQDISRAYELGANSYLVKPVGFDSLSETIKCVNHYWGALNQAPPL